MKIRDARLRLALVLAKLELEEDQGDVVQYLSDPLVIELQNILRDIEIARKKAGILRGI